MDNFNNTNPIPDNPDEAELALLFLDQLRFNLDSPAPIGLDPSFAETLRRIVRAMPLDTLSRVAKANLWREAQLRAGVAPHPSFSGNGRHKTVIQTGILKPLPHVTPQRRDRRILTAGFSTLLAAMLVIAIFGRFFQQPYNWGQGTATVNPVAISSFAYQTTQLARYLVWSPDGTQFASVEREGDLISLFDRNGGFLKSLVGHSGRINQIMWSPDGEQIATAGDDKSVRLWTSGGQTEVILASHSNRVDSVAWSPDGNILASASSLDGTVQLMTPKGASIRTFKFSPTPGDGLTTLYWSPDSKSLAVHYSSGMSDIWTLDGRISASFDSPDTQANNIAWSPDSQRIALATVKQGLQVYSLQGKLEKTLSTQSIPGALGIIRWTPDGRYIAVSDFMDNVLLWDVNGGKSYTHKIKASLFDMAFSPDGTLLALATLRSDGLGEVQVFNRQMQDVYTATASLTSKNGVRIAWSPDGQILLTKFDSDGVKSIVFDPQIIQSARKITPIAPAQVSVSVTVSSSVQPPETTNDKPLKLDETAQGELTRNQMEQTFSMNTDFEGQLLVLLQSDDFAINLSPQVICNNGGGGGGGGGSATGGSKLIKPQIVAVCKDGMVRLTVGSISGTETGKFNITTHKITAEPIESGKAIEAGIDQNTPFHYYTMSGEAGDLINVQFTPVEKDKALLTVDRIYLNLLPEAATQSLNSSALVREPGQFGVLVSAATAGSNGKFSLTVTRKEALTLSSTPQKVILTNVTSSAAFRIKGSAKPVLLKFKGLGGTSSANVVIQQVSTPEPSNVSGGGGGSGGSGGGGNGGGGGGMLPPIATLNIWGTSELSYKLSLSPDQTYILLIDRNGGANDIIDLEISVE